MTYVLLLCPAGLDPASHPVKIVGTQRVAFNTPACQKKNNVQTQHQHQIKFGGRHS